MSKAKVTFHRCIQDSQEYGSGDEFMVSRVFFTLEIGEEKYEGLYSDLKQTVGDDYETGRIEVSSPQGYDGEFNYWAFRDCAEKYYRSLVGSGARGIRVGKGSSIRMYNNAFNMEMVCEFEISGGSSTEQR